MRPGTESLAIGLSLLWLVASAHCSLAASARALLKRERGDTREASALYPSPGAAVVVRRGGDATAAANAKAAIDAMNGFYNQTDGRWSTSDAWWVTGNALQAVLDYTQKTGSREYMEKALHTFDLQRAPLPWWPQGGGDFRADSTDDTGWWALAMVRFYDVTGDAQYLDIAKEDEAYIYQYWSDSECGGGVIWSIRTLSYKNAISNELYMALAIALHNRIPGDTEYLSRALAAWQWFNASGMINAAHLVNDGLAESQNGTVCTNNGQTAWTYNQGVVLGALVGLHQATGEQAFLAEATAIADAVVHSSALSPGGVLTEPCEADGSCDNNSRMFKGIFCRNLAELDAALGGNPYRAYLEGNAAVMMARDRNASNFYDLSWNGPFNSSDIATQASAVSLLVSLL